MGLVGDGIYTSSLEVDAVKGVCYQMLPSRKRESCKYLKMVDLVGIEPTTSSMPWKRAPSCATGPLSRRTPLPQQRLMYFLLAVRVRQTPTSARSELEHDSLTQAGARRRSSLTSTNGIRLSRHRSIGIRLPYAVIDILCSSTSSSFPLTNRSL